MATASGRNKRERGSWRRHQKRSWTGDAESVHGKNKRFFGGKRKNGPARKERHTRRKNQGHNTTRRCLNPGEGSRRARKLIISTDFYFRLYLSPPFSGFRQRAVVLCPNSPRSFFRSQISVAPRFTRFRKITVYFFLVRYPRPLRFPLPCAWRHLGKSSLRHNPIPQSQVVYYQFYCSFLWLCCVLDLLRLSPAPAKHRFGTHPPTHCEAVSNNRLFPGGWRRGKLIVGGVVGWRWHTADATCQLNQ